MRKEAVLSSQIEGTQSSLSDLLAHEFGETPGVPVEDVAEVSRYVALRELGRLGIVRETTGRARGRVYAYVRYLEALNGEWGSWRRDCSAERFRR